MSSLRFRIILSMFAVIFLIVSGSYFVIQDIQTGIIEGEFRNIGLLLSNNLASEITNNMLIDDLVEVRKSVHNVKNNYPEIEYIYVTDLQGYVLVHSFDKGFPKALMDFTRPEKKNEEKIFETENGIIHEFDAPLFKNIGYVHIGLTENKVRAQINEASRKLLYLTICAMILGWIFVYFIGKRLTEPVLRLTDGAKRINKGILDQKIKINSNDELSELANTFNEMASSLDQKIKELISTREKTHEAEKYLETLFDSIEDGIIVINNTHEIKKMNRSFLKMIARKETDIIGKTFNEIILGNSHLETRAYDNPKDSFYNSITQGRFIHEIEIDHEKKILEINVSLFLDNKGIQNRIMVLRDVTQHKFIEDQIILRNRELAALNEISNIIRGTFDLDNILSRSLAAIQDLTGLESADAYLFDAKKNGFMHRIHLGTEKVCINIELRKVNEVLIVEDMKEKDKSFELSNSFAIIPLKSKDKILGLITLCSKKNHIFSGRDKDLFSAIGNQIGVALENIAFFDNIRYLKEFNDDILNNINMAIHVVDTNLKILAINNELIKLGKGKIRKELVIDNNLFIAFPFLKDTNAEMEYKHVIKTGEIFLNEEKTLYYGETIYTSTSKIPIKDKNGNVERIITVIKDISEKKKLEEELKDSYEELKLTYSKLNELYKIKDNFLANISHELRTPLTSVIGYTELMLDENLTQHQRHMTEIILRNSNRLSRLIKSLLDSQLIESKNLHLAEEKVVLKDILAVVIEDMKNISVNKNIPIKTDISDTLIIEGDIERLTQVFSNLIENALKFTIKGEINIIGELENQKVHIQIRDTGIGIQQEMIDKIFDRFYQVYPSDERHFGGTGLGLWISKNIIEAHGGRIWAESKNSGSTFHILLPGSVSS